MSEEQMENTLIDKTVQQHNEIIEKAKERAVKITANAEAEKKRIEAQTNNAIENIIGGELRAVHDSNPTDYVNWASFDLYLVACWKLLHH